MRRQIEVSNDVAAALSGANDKILRALEGHVACDLFLRGNVVTLDGEAEAVAAAAVVVRELADLIAQGHEIAEGTIAAVTGALDQHQSPAEILEDVVWRHRSTKVAPKTVNQKRYVDSIRGNTITFGIGPAGTGKTFLAVAMAAAALSRREVNRIILTRPAVEAGERLGFLPGDLMAKIDPYLRPLFDALHDMIDPEKVSSHLERNVIEVAPLAFMRGRAQPVRTPVLTPTGFRPIGDLEVGDLVVGSDGLPTPVLGVHPQGRKAVFRLSTQDGASTLCCAEHLWKVITPSGGPGGGAGRVVETREMSSRLRSHDGTQFELPVLSAPAELEPRGVPTDPYALGLLLGGGLLTATDSLGDGSRDRDRSRGGVLVADRAAVALRELDPAQATPATRFVPERYKLNAAPTRLATLQGLLDAGGEPVAPAGRSGAIRYATCSERLRDDVVFLVRSLGGVAHRTMSAAGAEPDGPSAFVLDIRLPEGIEPFRVGGKRDAYRAQGPCRPTRRVDRIEPAGEDETVCIQVGAADSLYVTEDFLVTHNTLNDSFVILDEAQNTSPEQMKMFLTRLGFNSKMVITGDITQIDLPREQKSGLVVVSEILGDVEGVEFVRFGGDDVVRHRLVQRIVEAYSDHAERLAPELRSADRKRHTR